MTDTKLRSWTKSITWRITGIVILGAITYLVTGNWEATTVIALTFLRIRLFLYYYHERLWEKIKWGIKQPEYQI